MCIIDEVCGQCPEDFLSALASFYPGQGDRYPAESNGLLRLAPFACRTSIDGDVDFTLDSRTTYEHRRRQANGEVDTGMSKRGSIQDINWED